MVECNKILQGTSRRLVLHYTDADRSGQVQIELDCGRLYQLVMGTPERKTAVVQKLGAAAQAGIVAGTGGLISNLKIWENLVLPARYHGTATLAELEEQARQVFAQLGYAEAQLMALCDAHPHELSLFEQKLVCFVRTMLVKPELLICDTLFDGLTLREVEKASRFSRIYLDRFPQRTFVHVCYDTSVLPERNQLFTFYL